MTAGLIGFFQLSLPKDSGTPAIITFCLLFLCVQIAFLAHDAVLNVIRIVLPPSYLLISYRKPVDEGEARVEALVFKSFKAVMTRLDFAQLFAICKAFSGDVAGYAGGGAAAADTKSCLRRLKGQGRAGGDVPSPPDPPSFI